MVLEKLNIHMQKNATRPLSFTIHKDKLKMDERSNCDNDSIKILEENTGNTLFELGHSNFLQDTSTKAKETKAKMNYWDFIKIRSFCTRRQHGGRAQDETVQEPAAHEVHAKRTGFGDQETTRRGRKENH